MKELFEHGALENHEGSLINHKNMGHQNNFLKGSLQNDGLVPGGGSHGSWDVWRDHKGPMKNPSSDVFVRTPVKNQWHTDKVNKLRASSEQKRDLLLHMKPWRTTFRCSSRPQIVVWGPPGDCEGGILGRGGKMPCTHLLNSQVEP